MDIQNRNNKAGVAQNKYNKLCPYFTTASSHSGGGAEVMKSEIINCCGELHIFETSRQKAKVCHAYCETTQWEYCPFAKQYESLLEQYGELKVSSQMYATSSNKYYVELYEDFPELDKHYALSMDSTYDKRKELRVGSLVSNTRERWNEADDAQLLDALTKYPQTEVGNVIGRSFGSVRARISWLRQHGRGDEVERALDKAVENGRCKKRQNYYTPEDRRRILELKVFYNKSDVEIAKIMGRDPTRPHRIRDLLKRLWAGEYKYNWSHHELQRLMPLMLSKRPHTLEEVLQRVSRTTPHTRDEILQVMWAIVNDEFKKQSNCWCMNYADPEKAYQDMKIKWRKILESESDGTRDVQV